MKKTDISRAQRFRQRAIFDVCSILVMLLLLSLISVALLSGNAPIHLYLKNDFLPQSSTLSFVGSWLFAYMIAWLILIAQPNQIRFDWNSRVILTTAAVFLIVAMGLYMARVPFLSRPVLASQLLVSTVGLIVILQFRTRIFRTVYGVYGSTVSGNWPENKGVEYRQVAAHDDLSNYAAILVDLANEASAVDTANLQELRQKGINLISRRDWFEFVRGQVLLSEVTLQDLERIKPPRFYVRVKRLVDAVLVIAAMPLLILLGSLISIAIKLDTKGPVFFVQKRTGLHGKEFRIFKFRSMTHMPNIEKASFAAESDARVTKVGRILRKYRLDEVPQVLNVLRGEMSLIGPRPEQPEIAARYLESISYYGFRHIVRSGISGWAQVAYGYAGSDEETKTKLEYDFFYIKHMSPWLDTVILFRTIWTVLTGRGAR